MDRLFSAVLFFGFLAVLLGPLFILFLPDLGKHRALHGMRRLGRQDPARLIDAR